MTEQEKQHLDQVCAALLPIIKIGVLEALREHDATTSITEFKVAEAFTEPARHPCGCRVGIEGCFSELHPEEKGWGVRIGRHPMDAPRPQPKAHRQNGKSSQEEFEALTGEFDGVNGEFDGVKWADVFVRTFPDAGVDKGTMLAWFANAIMAGYDHKAKEVRARLKIMQDCLNIQGSNGNWDADHYMFGMFNGMEHMMAIAEEREPQFRRWPKNETSSVSGDIGGTREVPGEHEVWAQAYASHWRIMQGFTTDYRVKESSEMADLAVKAFRERYK